MSKKISLMDDASALDGTEYVPLVQGGSNVKVTTKSLLAKRTMVPCGEWDVSGNLFPNTNGTGSGGAIEKYNFFVLVGSGILPGDNEIYEENMQIAMAFYDAPGQDPTKWKIY